MSFETIFAIGLVVTCFIAFIIWVVLLILAKEGSIRNLVCILIFLLGLLVTNEVAKAHAVEPPPPPKHYYDWQLESKREIKSLRRTTTERISQRGSSSYDQYQFLVKGETNGEVSWSEDEVPFMLNKIELVEQDRDNYVLEHNKAVCFIEGEEENKYPCSVLSLEGPVNEYIIYGPIGFTDTIGAPIPTD